MSVVGGIRRIVYMVYLTWNQLKDAIQNNKWQLFSRTKFVRTRYAHFKTWVLQNYPSVKDYILEKKLRHAKTEPMALLVNDFPYNLATEIDHAVIWCTSHDIDPSTPPPTLEAYQAFAAAHFDPRFFETLLYVNPVEARTVPDLPHCHVFSRATPAARLLYDWL